MKLKGMLVLALLALGSPAFAADAAPSAEPAPASANCGFSLDTVLATNATPAVVPAEPTEPGLMASRTCRCSCGQPCQSDADCGPGGRCTAGITCC